MSRPGGKDPRVTGPLFKRIAAVMRDRIEAGQYGPEDPLPTNIVLAKEFDAHRHTADKAYEELINEGLVISKGSRGRFVRVRKRHIYRPQEEFGRPTSEAMDRFMARITDEGGTPTQTISVSLVQPPERVAAEFGSGDAVVVMRERNRSIDGEPVYTNDSYYPLELVQGSEIMLPADIARGAGEVLAELGARVVRSLDKHLIRMPTQEEIARLVLLPATPVDELLTVGLTADGRPVRCMVSVLPGDRVEVVYERTRPDEEGRR
jgi:DNA-binding GntR family transcriptional regulator